MKSDSTSTLRRVNYQGIVILGAILITGYNTTTTIKAKQWTYVAANLIILGGLWLGAKALLEEQEHEGFLQYRRDNA